MSRRLQKRDPEPVACVRPPADETESRRADERREAILVVFVGRLHPDRLAFREPQMMVGEAHDLIASRLEVHLDAACLAVEKRAMAEGVEIEIGVELAVQ